MASSQPSMVGYTSEVEDYGIKKIISSQVPWKVELVLVAEFEDSWDLQRTQREREREREESEKTEIRKWIILLINS